MKKACTRCGLELDAEKDFNWKYKARGIRHSRCKSCMSQVCKQHYKENKPSYIERNRLRKPLVREENQRRIAAYLACHSCVDCGKTDIRVLEFDHVRGNKSGDISRMVQEGYSWATIEAEISKCEVRCVNCHRVKTVERSGFWRSFGCL